MGIADGESSEIPRFAGSSPRQAGIRLQIFYLEIYTDFHGAA
jgi:hypothetical protein